MRKNASFFSLIFHRFFEKNRRKIVQKARKPALCTKIDEKARSERRFLAKNRFLANFWAPPGSPGPSRDDPENSQNRSFFSFMVNCARKRARAASGRPQEGPGGPPRRPRGGILCPFFVLVLYAKSNRKKKGKHCKGTQTVCTMSSFLPLLLLFHLSCFYLFLLSYPMQFSFLCLRWPALPHPSCSCSVSD